MAEALHPSMRRTIVLVGLMGAGKSTTGSGLANKLGIRFIDSDKEVEIAEKRTIAEIYSQDGEEYFKKVEKKVIKKILNTNKPQVLSIGGNSFDDEDLRDIIKEKAISVFLDVDLDVLIRRVERRNNRPSLEGKDKPTVMTELYNEKYEIYSSCDVVVNTTYLNKDTTISVLIQKIQDFITNYNKK